MNEQKKADFVKRYNRSFLFLLAATAPWFLCIVVTAMAVFEIIEGTAFAKLIWLTINILFLTVFVFTVLKHGQYSDLDCPNCYTSLLEYEQLPIYEVFGPGDTENGKLLGIHTTCPNCSENCEDQFLPKRLFHWL